jgi:hypothetical protein
MIIEQTITVSVIMSLNLGGSVSLLFTLVDALFVKILILLDLSSYPNHTFFVGWIPHFGHFLTSLIILPDLDTTFQNINFPNLRNKK